METQDRFKMSDGFSIFYRRWRPQGEVSRVVLGLHGTGAHSGAFSYLGKRLSEGDGVEVYAVDRRGFGNSVEAGFQRGDMSSFGRYLADVDELVEQLKSTHQGRKIYILGKSEGCFHALRYAANHPGSVNGIILAAPPVVGKVGVPPGLIIRVILYRLFSPRKIVDAIKFQPEEQRESEEIKAAAEDPLTVFNYSARFLYGLSFLLRKVLTNAKRVRDPTLVLQGDVDNLVEPSGAKKLMDALATGDKELKVFPGANHGFYDSLPPRGESGYSEAKREQVVASITDWLKVH